MPEQPDRTSQNLFQASLKEVSDLSWQSRPQSGGYHPVNKRMLISAEKGQTKLYCHYDPTEFTETYSMEWKIVPITTAAVAPAVFTQAEPRKWSMKLLFNELGEERSRVDPNTKTVDESLGILRMFALPSSYMSAVGDPSSGFRSTPINASSGKNYDNPPVIVVFLTNAAFRCILRELTIVRKAIHPQTRRTTRAEVDVVFLEYLESAV